MLLEYIALHLVIIGVAMFIMFCVVSVLSYGAEVTLGEAWDTIERSGRIVMILIWLAGGILCGSMHYYKHIRNEKCNVKWELKNDIVEIRVSGSKVKEAVIIHEGN